MCRLHLTILGIHTPCHVQYIIQIRAPIFEIIFERCCNVVLTMMDPGVRIFLASVHHVHQAAFHNILRLLCLLPLTVCICHLPETRRMQKSYIYNKIKAVKLSTSIAKGEYF